jgi:polysaccharide biosynthesis protein PslJ
VSWTAVTSLRPRLGPRRLTAGDPTRPGRNLAVGFLVVYAVLLLLIPAQLVFRPLGAPGTPANLWAIGGLIWWCCLAVAPAAATTPIRVAGGLLAVSILASYANGMMSGWYAPPGVHQTFDDVVSLIPLTVDQVNALMLRAADRGLMTAAGWLGVLFVAAEGLRSWRDLETIGAWLSWLGAMVAAIGMVQYFTGVNIVQYLTIPGLSPNTEVGAVDGRSVLFRVSGTAVHPIEFGVVMACLFGLALHRTMYVRGRWWTHVPTALIFTAAFLAVSRSAMLCLIIVGLVLFAGWPARWRLRALLLTPLAVVGLRAAFPGLVGTLIALFTNVGNDPSVQGRTDDYAVVFDLTGDHPWLGRGVYTFLPQTYRVLDNQWLGILLELGLLGVLVVVGTITTSFLCARSAFRHARDERSRNLGLVLSAAILASAVAMLTYDSWAYRMQSGLAFLTMGLAGAAWRLAREDRAGEGPRTLP